MPETRPTAAEAARLAAKYARLAAKYDAAGVAVVVLTRDGRVTYAHHGLTRYFGPPAGALSDADVATAEQVLREFRHGSLCLDGAD